LCGGTRDGGGAHAGASAAVAASRWIAERVRGAGSCSLISFPLGARGRPNGSARIRRAYASGAPGRVAAEARTGTFPCSRSSPAGETCTKLVQRLYAVGYV